MPTGFVKVKRVLLMELLASHPEIKIPNAHRMSANTLYVAAHALGVHWSQKDGKWWTDGHLRGKSLRADKPTAESASIEVVVPDPPQVPSTSMDTQLLRFIAHRDVIDKVIADWLELAEVQNIEVLELSRKYDNFEDGAFQRVYIKVRKHYK